MQDSLMPHSQNGTFFPSFFPLARTGGTTDSASGCWVLKFALHYIPPPHSSPFSYSCACEGLHPVLLLIAFLKNVFFPIFLKSFFSAFSFLLQYSCTHCGTDVFSCDPREKKRCCFSTNSSQGLLFRN